MSSEISSLQIADLILFIRKVFYALDAGLMNMCQPSTIILHQVHKSGSYYNNGQQGSDEQCLSSAFTFGVKYKWRYTNILRIKFRIFSYPLIVTCVLGAQKNHLNEMVLLITQNMCLVEI